MSRIDLSRMRSKGDDALQDVVRDVVFSVLLVLENGSSELLASIDAESIHATTRRIASKFEHWLW